MGENPRWSHAISIFNPHESWRGEMREKAQKMKTMEWWEGRKMETK